MKPLKTARGAVNDMDIFNFESATKDDEEKAFLGLTDLSSVKKLKKILWDISKLGNVSVVAVDDDGAPISKRFSLNVFCSKMNNSEDFGDVCRKVHRAGLRESDALRDRFTYVCPFGLLETVIPVFVDNRLAGGIVIGQAKCENAPRGLADMTKNRILSPKKAVESDEMLQSFYDSIPPRDYGRYDALISLAAGVTESFVGNAEKVAAPGDDKAGRTDASREKVPAGDDPDRRAPPNLYFLLNALNSISNLSVLHGSMKINELSILTARFVKAANSNRTHNFPEEEKNIILLYLNIQKARFGDSLQFSANVAQNVKDALIPAEITLPFVERIFLTNGLTVSPKINVNVTFKKEDEYVVAEITDNVSRSPLTFGEPPRGAFLRDSESKVVESRVMNSARRLSAFRDKNAGISIKPNEGGGSKCVIRCPVIIERRSVND